MRPTRDAVIVAGWSWDIRSAIRTLGLDEARVATCDEKTTGECASRLPLGATVIYVFGLDTCYSSQLAGHFAWLHGTRSPAQEFVVRLPSVWQDARNSIFPNIRGVQEVTIDELRRLIAEPG